MLTLAEDYLKGRGGSVTEFQANLAAGQRLGQAFFNAASKKDQQRMRGTLNDPFYTVHGPQLHQTISWLLDTEEKTDA